MSTATFTETLQAEVATLQAEHPLLKGALDRAFQIVVRGDIFPLPDGRSAHVRSQSDPDTSHLVNGTCDCLATQYRKEPCVHRYAFRLYQKAVERLMGDPEEERWAPVDLPAAPTVLPEAPASANCHIIIAGRQVQLTLRDSDEARLLRRLQDVLLQYPVPVAPTQGQDDTPSCPTHGFLRKGKRGWFCPHKLDDDTWCKSKGK